MSDYFEKLVKNLNLSNYDDNWTLFRKANHYIDSTYGREILIYVLDNWIIINYSAKKMWLDLIERAGFYPYFEDIINSSNDSVFNDSLKSKIRASFYKSKYMPNIYFHEKQKEIEMKLSNGNNVAVSAPTSFGKSLLIEEMVARNEYKNILIIQPTLALIDETRRKLFKYSSGEYDYKIILNSNQDIGEKNIYILTAERVLEMNAIDNIDFFIVDEFYKVSNRKNDDRKSALNNAIYNIMKMNPQSLFLTPKVNSLSQKFRKLYKIVFFNTDYSLVNTKIKEIRNRNGNVYSSGDKKKKLFKLLDENKDEQNIVYVRTPREAYKLANEYIKFSNELKIRNDKLDVFEWIDENVSKHWNLKNLFKYGIGAHNGSLPRHIVTEEIDLFNSKKINVMFATTSLIEGVNTAAKNVFVYSKKKGNLDIDYFDYTNIIGRAGRMGKHFIGNVYCFENRPDNNDMVIDVPFVDQKNIDNEILINLNSDFINDKKVNKKRKNLVSGLNEELVEIISNNVKSVDGQKEIIKNIEKNDLDFLNWNNTPTYDQLSQTIEFGLKYLYDDNPKYANLLAVKALIYNNGGLKKLILNGIKHDHLKIDDAIEKALDFQRKEAGFKIPKILSVVESLYNFKHKEDPVDYSLFASLLENGNRSGRLNFLVDYGVPLSAIKKIDIKIPKEIIDSDEVISYIKKNYKEITKNMIDYELKLINHIILNS